LVRGEREKDRMGREKSVRGKKGTNMDGAPRIYVIGMVAKEGLGAFFKGTTEGGE